MREPSGRLAAGIEAKTNEIFDHGTRADRGNHQLVLNRRKRRQRRGRAEPTGAAGQGCRFANRIFESEASSGAYQRAVPLTLVEKGTTSNVQNELRAGSMAGKPPAYLADGRARATGRLAYASGRRGGPNACRTCYPSSRSIEPGPIFGRNTTQDRHSALLRPADLHRCTYARKTRENLPFPATMYCVRLFTNGGEPRSACRIGMGGSDLIWAFSGDRQTSWQGGTQTRHHQIHLLFTTSRPGNS